MKSSFGVILILWFVSAINSPHEAFLQVWWGKFYEAYISRFPDNPVFDVESFDKVLPWTFSMPCSFMFKWYEVVTN